MATINPLLIGIAIIVVIIVIYYFNQKQIKTNTSNTTNIINTNESFMPQCQSGNGICNNFTNCCLNGSKPNECRDSNLLGCQ